MKSLFAYGSPLWSLTEKLLHYLWLSMLWFLCCLPVFTIGASTTALYTVALKYVRKEDSYLTSSFFRAFRENWKQATVIWLIFLLAAIPIFSGLVLYFRQENMGGFFFILMTCFLSLLLAFLLAGTFVYPLLAAFENTTGKTVQNALIMALTHPGSGIAMLTITFLILAAGLVLFPPLLFVSPTLIACINSRFFHKIFDCYKPETAENNEMA